MLTLIPGRDGAACVRDEAGGFWRATHRIRNASSRDTATEPGQVLAAARAFGEFLRLLSDLEPRTLHEVIPDFHDLAARLQAFDAAVEADVSGRVRDVGAEVAFVRDHAGLVEVLPSLSLPAGLPVRATHNDTKVNNALLDDDTGESLSARILAQEHRLYSEVVAGYFQGRFRLDGRRVPGKEKRET